MGWSIIGVSEGDTRSVDCSLCSRLLNCRISVGVPLFVREGITYYHSVASPEHAFRTYKVR